MRPVAIPPTVGQSAYIVNCQLANAFQGIHGSEVRVENSNVNVVGGNQHTHFHTHTSTATDEEKAKLMAKFEAIMEAISNYRRIQQDTLAKATPGTILWLLECKEFRLFVDVDGSLKFMWGSGMRAFFL